MSVITTIFTKYCTVHATDSLISRVNPDGTVEHTEWQQSKIIRLDRWRGAMSYWGLACHDMHGWNTHDWLSAQTSSTNNIASSCDFAKRLCDNLNNEINRISSNNPQKPGIGIHLSAYEYIEEHWIPELYLITNFKDPTYSTVFEKLYLTRETYYQITNKKHRDNNGDSHLRLAVYNFLQSDNILIFNNGDPQMFNIIANTIFGLFRISALRRNLKDQSDINLWLNIAQRPIEIVSKAQHDFYRKATRIVGGKPHSLAITPSGEYFTNTGG